MASAGDNFGTPTPGPFTGQHSLSLAAVSIGYAGPAASFSGDWPSPGPELLTWVYPLAGGLQLTDMVGRRDRNLGPLNRDTNRRLHTHVRGITIHSSQTVGAAQVSVNRGTDKQNMVSIYNRI